MPFNPFRKAQGGDVEGTTKTDVSHAVGGPITVSKAPYDPGYSLETTLTAGQVAKYTPADLLRGYCDYGSCIGDPGSDKMR